MTTLAIPSPSAFSTPSKIFERNFGQCLTGMPSFSVSKMRVVEDYFPSSTPIPDGFLSISEMMSQLASSSPSANDAILRARERYAQQLDGDGTVKHLRLRAGLSQSELARQIGTSQAHVSRIENGLDIPKMDTGAKFCRALGVDMNTLLRAIEAQQVLSVDGVKSV